MRLAAVVALIGLLLGLLWAAGAARADAPPDAGEPPGERWSADPRLWLALIEWRQRLRLELTSSREICTAGTLTEVSWAIAGGKPPYSLQVEGASVDVDADSVRINCGVLSEAEAADGEADLAAKRITAVVTDSRGVRREAAIEVARARALPAPTGLSYGSHFESVLVGWSEADPSLATAAVARYRPIGAAEWSYSVSDYSVLTLETPTGEHMASVAAIRHVLEAETPDALNWSEELRYARTVAPQNLIATATHDTITVAWDKQPYTTQMPSVRLTTTNRDGSLSERVFEEDGEYGRHEVVFKHVPPDTEYVVTIIMSDWGTLVPTSTTVRTAAAPAGWTPPPRGPQNLRATATRDNITVTWEHPHDAVRAPYIVELIDEHSGNLLNHTWVSTQTSWTGRARNGAALRPGKQYRIRVKLTTFTLPTVEVVVRVPVETTALRYNAYDAVDEAAVAGSYSFLSDSGDAANVVAVYEGLRDGTAKRLLVNEVDGHGVSRTALYDAVAAGDFFEWREADDCWVRYRVTEVLPDPSGVAPRKLFAVEWMTYAFTGCSGVITANAAVVFDWGPLPDLGGVSLVVPVRHGPFQIAPEDWSGQVEEDPFRPWPGNSYNNPVATADLAEARRLPYWRDPTLPSGWTLSMASSGDPGYDPPYGYCAWWANDRGYGGVEICGGFYLGRDRPWESSWNDGRGVVETRTIAGRSSIVVYSPPGPNHNRYRSIEAWVYEPTPHTVYRVRGLDWTLNGSNVDAVIAIARSLFEE